jgi:hypothetical protein
MAEKQGMVEVCSSARSRFAAMPCSLGARSTTSSPTPWPTPGRRSRSEWRPRAISPRYFGPRHRPRRARGRALSHLRALRAPGRRPRHAQGQRLGLAIVQRVAELHGGRAVARNLAPASRSAWSCLWPLSAPLRRALPPLSETSRCPAAGGETGMSLAMARPAPACRPAPCPARRCRRPPQAAAGRRFYRSAPRPVARGPPRADV